MSDKTPTWHVGQTVIRRQGTGSDYKRGAESTHTVARVARKNLYIDLGWGEQAFAIADGWEVKGSRDIGDRARVGTPDQWAEWDLEAAMRKRVREATRGEWIGRLSTADAQTILNILGK